MAQQINLCSSLPPSRRQSFSANTMALALLVFAVVGGALSAGWVISLQRAGQGYAQTLASQERDIQALKTALAAARSSAAPLDAALQQQLQGKHTEVAQREQVLQALKEGVFVPGMGQSDRLTLVARTIPQDVWITELKADAARLELTGFTLEPAALNEWVQALAASAQMQGVPLASVRVENVAGRDGAKPVLAVAPAPGSKPLRPGVPVWAFTLVSQQPRPASKTTGSTP